MSANTSEMISQNSSETYNHTIGRDTPTCQASGNYENDSHNHNTGYGSNHHNSDGDSGDSLQQQLNDFYRTAIALPTGHATPIRLSRPKVRPDGSPVLGKRGDQVVEIRLFAGRWQGDRLSILKADLIPNSKEANGRSLYRINENAGDCVSEVGALCRAGFEAFCYPSIALEGDVVGMGGDDAARFSSVFFEIDGLTLDEQRAKVDWLKSIGLTPTATVFSGSKSLHNYFRLDTPLNAADWVEQQRLLIVALDSDPAICSKGRAMRLPGVYRSAKGNEQRLEAVEDVSYTPQQIKTALNMAAIAPYGFGSSDSGEYWQAYRRARVKEGRDQALAALQTFIPAKEARRLEHWLSSSHAAELLDSGIDATTAQQLGIQTVNGPTLKHYGYSGGLTDDDGFQYLLFPYCDPWGEPITWEDEQGKTYPFGRVKLPEGKRHGKQKYSQPKGSPICAYIPHALGDFCNTFGIGKDGAETGCAIRGDFHITEGEKKAIAATLAGMPCLGIGGVQSYKALWVQEFALNCRSMTIIFDSDIWSNPKISDALTAFGGWLWHVQQHWFINSQIVPAMDEQAADDWQNTHGDSVPAAMLPEVPRCYEFGWDTLLSNRFYFGLLPIGYKGQKLGLDDYLMADCNAGLRDKILGVKLPLLCGDRVLFNIKGLWDIPTVRRNIILSAEGDKKEYYWDGRKAVTRTKDTKVGEMKQEIFFRWPQYEARDLLALMVVATLDFNGLITGDLSWRWHEQIWQLASGVEVQNSCGGALAHYGIPDGNSGIDRLIQRHTITWLQGKLPPSDYIGLVDCDLNTFDGTEAPIHPKNFSQYRVTHPRRAGLHPKWDSALLELFGDENAVRVFWAILRVGLASPKARGLLPFLPCIIGAPGSGKSAIMRVLSEGLGGLVGVQKVSDLYANNANNGFIPLHWLKSRLIYDDDFKSQGKIPSEAIANINKITTAADLTCRAMGKDAVVLPCSINMLILANKIPAVNGNDAEGFHRRFLPLMCQGQKRVKPNPNWHTEIVRDELPAIIDSLFKIDLSIALAWIDHHARSESVQSILADVVAASQDDVAEWVQAVWNANTGNKYTPVYLSGWDSPAVVTPDDVVCKGLTPDSVGWLSMSEAHASYSRFCRVTNASGIPKNKSHFSEAVVLLGGQRPGRSVRGWLKDEHGQISKQQLAMIQLPPPPAPLNLDSGIAA